MEEAHGKICLDMCITLRIMKNIMLKNVDMHPFFILFSHELQALSKRMYLVCTATFLRRVSSTYSLFI